MARSNPHGRPAGLIGLALAVLAFMGISAQPAGAQAAPPAGYVLNKDQSRILFTIGHFFVSSTDGHFTVFDGRLVFQPQAPEQGMVTIHVSPGSNSTAIAARDVRRRAGHRRQSRLRRQDDRRFRRLRRQDRPEIVALHHGRGRLPIYRHDDFSRPRGHCQALRRKHDAKTVARIAIKIHLPWTAVGIREDRHGKGLAEGAGLVVQLPGLARREGC